MMKPEKVSDQIHGRLIADQTSIFWSAIENFPQQGKSFNLFFAWNIKADIKFETQFNFNEFLFKEADKLKEKENEIQKLINSQIDKGQFIYRSNINYQLANLTSEVEQLKKEFQKTSERDGQILLLKNHVVWYLLDCKELAQLLIDYGLPVINIDDNFWLGYFGNFNKKELFFSRFEKLSVNPLDYKKMIVSDLRQTLLHYGDLARPSTGLGSFNSSTFYKQFKQTSDEEDFIEEEKICK